MRISDLSQNDMDRLVFEARDRNDVRNPILSPPSAQQMQSLRFAGFIIGPNEEILRIVGGNLRECVNGIPCTYFCNGFSEGKCVERGFPICGVADGACLLTHEPCNSFCTQGK